MRLRLIIVGLAICFSTFSIAQEVSTYTNPVIHADYSDPDVVRVGNDYYI
jgi:beta-xylosidase